MKTKLGGKLVAIGSVTCCTGLLVACLAAAYFEPVAGGPDIPVVIIGTLGCLNVPGVVIGTLGVLAFIFGFLLAAAGRIVDEVE